jgi:hypothetical protein
VFSPTMGMLGMEMHQTLCHVTFLPAIESLAPRLQMQISLNNIDRTHTVFTILEKPPKPAFSRPSLPLHPSPCGR